MWGKKLLLFYIPFFWKTQSLVNISIEYSFKNPRWKWKFVIHTPYPKMDVNFEKFSIKFRFSKTEISESNILNQSKFVRHKFLFLLKYIKLHPLQIWDDLNRKKVVYNFLKPSNVIFLSKIFSWDNLKIPMRMVNIEIFIVSRCQDTPSSFPIQTFSFLIVKLSNNFRLICGVKNFWKEWSKKLVSQINKVFYSKIHPIDEVFYWSQVWLTFGH